MKRGFLVAVACAIALSACGGETETQSQAEFVADNTPVDFSTTPEQIDGVWYVPDFEFILGDGSVFSTAENELPIVLMFWAEW